MLEEFKRIGRLLSQGGLIDSHGGSLSRRQGEKIFITRREAMLGELQEGDLIEVGLAPGESDSRASRELNVHRAVYRETRAAAIVQALPANAIAVSITDNKIIPQDAQGLALFRAAAIVRVHQPIGSEETARLLPSFLQGSSVIAVVKGYGSWALGQDLVEAYKYTSALENSCRVLVAVRASGGQRPPLPKDKPRELHPHPQHRSAIPPGIGVMDRSRYHKR